MANQKSGTLNEPSKLLLALPIVSRVQIRAVRLVETSARVVLVAGRYPTEMSVDVKTTTEFDETARAIRVLFKFSGVGRYKEPDAAQAPLEIDAGQSPLQIDVAFILEYDFTPTEGLRKENFDAFGELNGVYNAWPYCREYVQSLTLRMGLPSLVIPVLRVLEQ